MSRATEAFVAANCFALGPRPGELGLRGGDPRGWLLAQLDGPQASRPELDGLPAAAPKVAEFLCARKKKGELKAALGSHWASTAVLAVSEFGGHSREWTAQYWPRPSSSRQAVSAAEASAKGPARIR